MSGYSLQAVSLDLELPWSPNEEQEEKFIRTLKRIAIMVAILFIVIPFLPTIEKDYIEPDKPVVKTKVLLKPVQLKSREKPIEPKAPPKPKPKPKPKKASDKQTTSAGKARTQNKVPVEQSQGLTDLSSQLSALRGSIDLAKMQRKNVTDTNGGKAIKSTRDLLGKDNATKRSGGIEVDSELISNQPTGLSAYETTAVEGVAIEAGTGVSSASYSSYQTGRRDMESIRRTFEQKKAGIFAIYNKMLLSNPELSGKFIFKLVILPDGSISNLELISSELGIQSLEESILHGIKQINFGPKDVSATSVEYTFQFLPS